MIFSFQKLQTAMGYLAGCYDKIIFVDLEKDSWDPIKVRMDEWEGNRDFSLTKWLRLFANGEFSDGFEETPLIMNIHNGYPYAKSYYKVIKGVRHLVTLEYLPIDKDKGYILVFDHEKFERGETCGEKD